MEIILCEIRAVYLARLSEHLSELAEFSAVNSHPSTTGCFRREYLWRRGYYKATLSNL